MTSDAFFAQNTECFDLVFVDGLHLREQVLRDVENSLRWLSPGGCIVLHDCLPTQRVHQLREPAGGGVPWTGDVWKAVVELRQRPDLDLAVLNSDWGLGVLFARPNSDRLEAHGELEWDDFVAGRERLLRVVDEAGMMAFVRRTGTLARPPVGAELTAMFDAGLRLPSSVALETGETRQQTEPAIEGTATTGRSARPTDRSKRLTIALAHSNLGQFRHLHTFLNQSGLATSYLFCSEANFRKHSPTIPNLVPFVPHGGKLEDPHSFSYLKRIETANRRSLGLRAALRRWQAEVPIDLFVGHVTAGSPSMLFGEFSFPIVSYLEFPSFQSHGWDTQFPPPEIKKLRDKNFDMLSCHAVLRSEHSIVPSAYARSLFPIELQPKISVLMEGFPLDRECWSQGGVLPKNNGEQYVGFAARDLSSAKGFQQFVRIANAVGQLRPNVRFVVLGGDNVLYSYENEFLDARLGPGHGRSFRDWVMEHEQADRSRFVFPGLVGYETYSRFVNDIDLFLYPLQFGSANWGLFELLGRGRVVVASNRCYVPEVITHGENGFLCDYDDVASWVARTLEILDHPEQFRSIGKMARQMSLRYSMDRVAEQFLTLCERVIAAPARG